MTAEANFDNYVQTSKGTGTNKVLDGCWLLSLFEKFFDTFELNNLSEKWLSKHSSLQSSVKRVAQKLSHDLIQYL